MDVSRRKLLERIACRRGAMESDTARAVSSELPSGNPDCTSTDWLGYGLQSSSSVFTPHHNIVEPIIFPARLFLILSLLRTSHIGPLACFSAMAAR